MRYFNFKKSATSSTMEKKRKRSDSSQFEPSRKKARIESAIDVHSPNTVDNNYSDDNDEQIAPLISSEEVSLVPKLPTNRNSAFKSVLRSVFSLNFRSLKQIYDLNQYELKNLNVSIIPGCGKQMPLVGRENHYDEMWEHTMRHLKDFKSQNQSRNNHAIFFAIGVSGIGKTRFALQLQHELEKRAEKCNDEDIKHYFVNTLFVQISFGYGSSVEYEEEQLLKEKNPNFIANYMLVSRALKSLFGIPFNNWNINNLPSWFTISHLTEYLSKTFSTTTHELTIIWHFDDVQGLIAYPFREEVGLEAIKILGEVFRNTPSVLLCTGSTLGMLLDYSYIVAQCVNVCIDLKPLESKEIDQVVDTIATTPEFKTLIPRNWREVRGFKQLLATTGGVPRMLELVLQSILEMQVSIDLAKMIDIQHQFWKLVKLRYHWFFSHSSLGSSAISWTFMGLSNKDIEMIKGQTSSSINILNNYGMMYTTQRENQWTTFLPWLYISLTESTYEVPRHFKEFWKRMCDPTETFTKKDFQTLSFMCHTMHIDAFLKSGIYSVPLALLFAGTTCKNVMDVSVKLHNVHLCNLQRSWPGTTTWPALQGQFCSEGKEMVGYLFSNAEGSIVDAIELFEVEKPKSNYKFIMVAYKIKFGQAKLTANEIIEDWKNITGALKKSNDSEYISFMKKVRIVLFMCTNRSFEDNIHEQVTDLWDGGKRNTPRYIITDNIETYLGPFKNVIQSFDKSS